MLPRPPSLRVWLKRDMARWAAGASPNSKPVASETVSVNASTEPSSESSATRGSPSGLAATSARIPTYARANPAAPTCHGKQDALGEHLPNQRRAAGAHRGPYSHLAAAAHGPREVEIGHVHAPAQQHEHHRGHQHPQQRLRVPHGVVVEGLQLHVPAVVVEWIGFLEACGEPIDPRLRLRQGHTGRESPDPAQIVVPPRIAASLGIQVFRHPDVRVAAQRISEARGHHSQNGVRLVVQEGSTHPRLGGRRPALASKPRG